MKRGKLIVALLLAIACIVIVLQNTGPMQTRIFFVTVRMPRAVMLFITSAIGFVVGLLTALNVTRRR